MARRIAVMASYPARMATLGLAVRSIATQCDKVILVLNEWEGLDLPEVPSNCEIELPSDNLMDVGKFFHKPDDDDICALCDDDIVYPGDYMDRMERFVVDNRHIGAVACVHGIIYPDFFDGDPLSRLVYSFTQSLEIEMRVNQGGTGTVVARGSQIPSLDFMRGSQRFVDVRFSVFCHRNRWPIYCVPRARNWMVDLEAGNSIFSTFTAHWPKQVAREVQEIAGFRHLVD